ncbi:cyclic nucleotide-binding domain-containing protein [Leptolyngbya sp. FACHB-261]|uniref:cyclic nucleotide-binding domain-containing protein n=1 Tax=Leptolyngbya sp. FACHB-261 TaxID=2692806 RepID=UPI0016846B13|nr:cyclic nucleotide-binding domain-containing protein [Leptolyngbya sp. FACHB-261]MBD2100902.1 cyclic nucleotide-binding domain-containing protein [Leptolyngbya sp. FACHB-261]
MLRKIFLDQWAATQILQGQKKVIVRPYTGRWTTLHAGELISLYCEHPEWERARVRVCSLQVWQSLSEFLALGLAEAAPGLTQAAAEEIYGRLYRDDLAAGCQLISISVEPVAHQAGVIRFFCEQAGRLQIIRHGRWRPLNHPDNQPQTLATLQARLEARGWRAVYPAFFHCTSRSQFAARIEDVEVQRLEAFAALSPARRQELKACLQEEYFSAGAVISGPTQEFERVLILRSGRAVVFDTTLTQGTQFTELGAGDRFQTETDSGNALERRELTLRAITEVRAFSLSREQYHQFTGQKTACVTLA